MRNVQYREILAVCAASVSVMAQTEAPVDRYQVPATVSADAETSLRTIYGGTAQRPAARHPVSDAEWDQRGAQIEALYRPQAEQFADSIGVATAAVSPPGRY